MARLLDQIVGHSAIIERLLSAIDSGRLSSTFLFVGHRGVGKKAVALGLAQALLCEKSARACGQCAACLRVSKHQSEGLFLLEPEKNHIKVDQAREVLSFLNLKSISRARIVIIDDAESLNVQAANTLLKILEEPPENTYFFLMAPSSLHLLPTIRSRAQIVHFAPPSFQEMRQKSTAPDWILRASKGSFSRLGMLQEKSELETSESAYEFMKAWLSNRKAFISSEWKDEVRNRSSSLVLARHLVLFFREAVMCSFGQNESGVATQHQDLIKKMAELPKEKLLNATEAAMDLEGALLSNRDCTLTFEEFWIKTAEA